MRLYHDISTASLSLLNPIFAQAVSDFEAALSGSRSPPLRIAECSAPKTTESGSRSDSKRLDRDG